MMSDNSSTKDGGSTESSTQRAGDDPTLESLIQAYEQSYRDHDLSRTRVAAMMIADLVIPKLKKGEPVSIVPVTERMSEQSLIQRLYAATQQVRVGSTWRHIKSNDLVVIQTVNLDEETLEPRVGYYHGSLEFSRRIEAFLKSFKPDPG